MRNKICKWSAFALAVCVAFGAAGCKKSGGKTGEGVVSISLWDSGWGSEWLYAMADAFMEDYGYEVLIDASESDGDISNLLPNPDQHTYDIIMGCNTAPELYDSYYEILDDVVTSVNIGETKTVGEKIGPEFLSMLKNASGHYDKLCYGTGYYNIIYKQDIFDYYQYSVPNTTDEMVALIGQMKSDGVIPFIHFQNGGYWHSMLWTWAIQYAGTKDFYALSQDPKLADLTDDNNGIPQGLKVMYSMIGDNENYYTGSSSMTFSLAQTNFLMPSEDLKDEVAMMVNGAWLENELRFSEDELNETVRPMKTPVVSAIVEKCPTINDDATLSAVIDAIDQGKTSYQGVSEDDFNRIATARKVEVTNAPGLEFCIPNYSDNIQGAKDFLKFFFSDKALQIWFDTTHVRQFTEFDDESRSYSTTGLSEFCKAQLEVMNVSVPVAEGRPHSSHRIFIAGGASLVPGFDNAGYAASMVNYPPKSDSQIWTSIKQNFEKNWATYWKNAGFEVPET